MIRELTAKQVTMMFDAIDRSHALQAEQAEQLKHRNAASYRAGWYARHDGQTIPPGASDAFIDGWMARHERHEAMVRAECVEVTR